MLRPLAESDVTERYLNWLRDIKNRKYITTGAKMHDLENLKSYVRGKIAREDVMFLGIFEKGTGLHIGNIKYEPVSPELGYAIMGILIGDPKYRGRGVTGEVLIASARWLKRCRKIKQIILGVDKENSTAIRAYEKVGFVFSKTKYIPNHPATMVWDLMNAKDFTFTN